MLLTALHFFFIFIMADLAYRRKLEGQICADTVRYHIAGGLAVTTGSKNVHAVRTSSWPDGPSPPLTFARGRCERRQASNLWGIRKMSGQAKRAWTVPPPPSHPFSPVSRLIPKVSAQLYNTSGHISWHLVHPALQQEWRRRT